MTNSSLMATSLLIMLNAIIPHSSCLWFLIFLMMDDKLAFVLSSIRVKLCQCVRFAGIPHLSIAFSYYNVLLYKLLLWNILDHGSPFLVTETAALHGKVLSDEPESKAIN